MFLSNNPQSRWENDGSGTTGTPPQDLSWQGLVTRAATHELYAARHADPAGGCALLLGHGLARGRALLWVRHDALIGETGAPYAPGVSELGLDVSDLILVRARHPSCALQAALEGARCPALGAVIVEIRGETTSYDLTASRRLALAAKTSGTPVFIVRSAAEPQPSAAETRWLVRPAPSGALAANAPGDPRLALTLLRARNGRDGLCFHLEWNRDAKRFLVRAGETNAAAIPSPGEPGPAPLPRRVVPVSFDRPDPPRSPERRFARTG